MDCGVEGANRGERQAVVRRIVALSDARVPGSIERRLHTNRIDYLHQFLANDDEH